MELFALAAVAVLEVMVVLLVDILLDSYLEQRHHLAMELPEFEDVVDEEQYDLDLVEVLMKQIKSTIPTKQQYPKLSSFFKSVLFLFVKVTIAD